MLDWTDSRCRNFHRILTKHALLYTEMVTTGALIYGDAHRHLYFQAKEHPIALQLGGSQPQELAVCAKMAEDYGYDEVNLNVGCPSDRVQSGRFGACLMADPALVAECAAAMIQATTLPVSIKCRIGIDQQDEFEDLHTFVTTVAEAGVETFIVHARKAWLDGLSPKQNRDIPPLNYPRVYQLKREFRSLEIILNGGIQTLAEAQQHLDYVDGVMMGRSAYQSPMQLKNVDQLFYGANTPPLSDQEIIASLCDYVDTELSNGTPIKHITRHVVGLFQNRPGAKQWRRHLSEHAYKEEANVEVIRKAADFVGISL